MFEGGAGVIEKQSQKTPQDELRDLSQSPNEVLIKQKRNKEK